MQTFFKMNTVVIRIPSGEINAKVGVGSLWWLRGLIRVPSISNNNGLLLRDTHLLHTYGIAHAVDCIFLNRDHQIIHIAADTTAKKFISYPEASHILVLDSGQANALDLKNKMILMLT